MNHKEGVPGFFLVTLRSGKFVDREPPKVSNLSPHLREKDGGVGHIMDYVQPHSAITANLKRLKHSTFPPLLKIQIERTRFPIKVQAILVKLEATKK